MWPTTVVLNSYCEQTLKMQLMNMCILPIIKYSFTIPNLLAVPFLTHLIEVGQVPTHKGTARDSVMIHVRRHPAGTILIDNHFLLHA